MIMKRRLDDAGLSDLFSAFNFRVSVVIDLLSQSEPLENQQYLAGHSRLSMTRVHDRCCRKVTATLERISIFVQRVWQRPEG